MSTIGANTFYFEVTDISGNYVPDLSASNFSILGEIEDVTYSDASLVSFRESSIQNGGYFFTLNIGTKGRGMIKVIPNSSDHFITPEFYDVDFSQFSIDNAYNLMGRSFFDVGIKAPNSTYVSKVVNTKEGDDAVFLIGLSEDISGWTDWKSTAVYTLSEESSGSNVIGDLTIMDVDPVSKTVTLKIPHTLTNGIIGSGKSSITIYSDLQAVTNTSLRKTVAEMTINVKRQATKT